MLDSTSTVFHRSPLASHPHHTLIVGLVDDVIRLKPLAKLIAQIATGTLISSVLDINLTSDYPL